MSAARYLYLEPLCQDLAGLLQGVDGIHIEHTTDVITLPMLQLLSLCGLSGDRGCPLITSELAKGLTCSLAERHWVTFTALIKSLNHVQLLLWQMGEMPQQISQCLWQSQRQVGRDNQPTTQVQRVALTCDIALPQASACRAALSGWLTSAKLLYAYCG